MNESEEILLDALVQSCTSVEIVYASQGEFAQVLSISKIHNEDLPCAVLSNGKYVALYNAELKDFGILKRL